MLITTMKELSKRLLRRILRPWLIYQVFRANLSRVKEERIGMAYYFDEYPFGINIGARHITVSTCGIVPKILEFSDFPLQINLAISLHAPNNEIRNKIMPINKVYPIQDLIKEIRNYVKVTNRRVTFEYAGIDEVVQHKVDNAVGSAEMHCRFRAVAGEGLEAATLAACHNHAKNIFLVFPGIRPTHISDNLYLRGLLRPFCVYKPNLCNFLPKCNVFIEKLNFFVKNRALYPFDKKMPEPRVVDGGFFL